MGTPAAISFTPTFQAIAANGDPQFFHSELPSQLGAKPEFNVVSDVSDMKGASTLGARYGAAKMSQA